MTKEEILAMEAGRELDKEVAEQLFNYKVEDRYGYYDPECGSFCETQSNPYINPSEGRERQPCILVETRELAEEERNEYLKDQRWGRGVHFIPDSFELWEELLGYSTDISAAWPVVEKVEGAWDIKKRYRPYPDDPPGSGGRATYQATVFLSDYDPYEDDLVNKRTGRSPWCWSVEEAICKAALLAKLKGGQNGETNKERAD